MADLLSVQLLSFNFASRKYAYTRLAQGLNKSVNRIFDIIIFLRHLYGAQLSC